MGVSKRQRLAQLAAWLRANYPTPFPVTLRLVTFSKKDDCWGITTRVGRRLHVLVDRRLTWEDMEGILIHEWAHAVAWRHETLERRRSADHSDEWGLAYAKIYRDIHDLKRHKGGPAQ